MPDEYWWATWERLILGSVSDWLGSQMEHSDWLRSRALRVSPSSSDVEKEAKS